MSEAAASDDRPYRVWVCASCFFEYDEAQGLPEHGIAAGTRFEDLPDDWVCPECGSPKEYFEPLPTVGSE